MIIHLFLSINLLVSNLFHHDSNLKFIYYYLKLEDVIIHHYFRL